MPIALSVLCVLSVVVSPVNALAYVGPGLGLGTLGVVLGVVGSVFVALFALLWYPLKRIFRKRKKTENKDTDL